MQLTLAVKTILTQNTAIYRFAYPEADMLSGMRVKSVYVLKAPLGELQEDGTKAIVGRPYR
jgi:hypothetical protein